jgi:hypothetical protein
MAAPNSPYKTLSGIRLGIIKDTRSETSALTVTQIDRWINEGYEILAQRKKRKWLDQQFTVQLNAAVEATCSVTEGSSTVTFETGTTFPTGVELQFWSQGFEEVYNVASSTLNVVTLDKPFLGETNTATQGTIYQSSIILDSSIREVFQVYHQYDDQPLANVGPQQMRLIQEQGNVQLDEATYYTLFGESDGSKRMILYPYPKNAYTLYLDVNVIPDMLVDSTDEPLLPMKYRQLLYWYGMFKVWSFRQNDSQAATALTTFTTLANQMDGELSPTVDYPTIRVSYPRRSSLRRFAPVFDPRMRQSD